MVRKAKVAKYYSMTNEELISTAEALGIILSASERNGLMTIRMVELDELGERAREGLINKLIAVKSSQSTSTAIWIAGATLCIALATLIVSALSPVGIGSFIMKLPHDLVTRIFQITGLVLIFAGGLLVSAALGRWDPKNTLRFKIGNLLQVFGIAISIVGIIFSH